MLLIRTHVKFSELTLLVVSALIPTFQRFLVKIANLHGKLSTPVVAPGWWCLGAELSKKS